MNSLDSLQQKLNLTDGDGNVITFFNGKVTLSQLLVIVVCIIAVCLFLKLLKGVLKIVIPVVCICLTLIYFGVVSPQQLYDVAGKIKETGVDTFQKFADSSENIKIENETIYICVDDKWVDISDINTVIEGKFNSLTLGTDDGVLEVKDENISALLDELSSK